MYSFLILYYTGKSDPDGKKAGDDVDMNVVNRLIDFYNGQGCGASNKNAVIAFFKPFIGREETVLQLIILLFNHGEKSTNGIEDLMKLYPEGQEDEMHAFVVNAFAEKAAAEATAAAAASTTTGASSFWGAEGGSAVVQDEDDLSTSSLFENKAPVADEPVDIVEDHAHKEELAASAKNKEHAKKRVDADDEKEISEKITKKNKKKSRITRSSMVIDD